MAWITNVRRLANAIPWSAVHSGRGWSNFVREMERAEADSSPTRCVAALSALLDALRLRSLCEAGIPTTLDGRPLALVSSTLVAELRAVVAVERLRETSPWRSATSRSCKFPQRRPHHAEEMPRPGC